MSEAGRGQQALESVNLGSKNMNVRIRVADRALESMVLSASESFVLGDGNKPQKRRWRGKRYVETFGFVWGYRQEVDDGETEHIHIDRFYESLSARRKSNSVTPNEDAVWLKNSIIKRWSPHLLLLGDFHTHPYKSRQDVEDRKGWEFSVQDVSSFKEDKHLWRLANQKPLMFVMAVAPIKRVRETEAKWLYNNTWVFTVGQLPFWLTVGVGYRRKKKTRLRETESIWLDLDPRFLNVSGDRLTGIR